VYPYSYSGYAPPGDPNSPEVLV